MLVETNKNPYVEAEDSAKTGKEFELFEWSTAQEK
jgi:hypothetical protein